MPYVGDWFFTASGDSCWYGPTWIDPYEIRLSDFTITTPDRRSRDYGASTPVAGPFDTLEAAHAAYLIILESHNARTSQD